MSDRVDCLMTTGNVDDHECNCSDCREGRRELDHLDWEMHGGDGDD